MEEIRLWAPIVLSLLALVYSISTNRGKAQEERVAKSESAVNKRLDALEETVAQKVEAVPFQALVGKVDIVEDRASRLEGELKHLPTRDQTHELALSIKDMKVELATLTANLVPISRTSERLQEFLIDQATQAKK